MVRFFWAKAVHVYPKRERLGHKWAWMLQGGWEREKVKAGTEDAKKVSMFVAFLSTVFWSLV
jgi:hypothetical protein